MEAKELIQLREYGFQTHVGWKQRSRTSDLITQNKWKTVWPDSTIDETDPLVENIYNEALNDKAATVGAIEPFVLVSPTRGSRDDPEKNAQKRRRIFVTFMRDSDVDDKQTSWAFDWLQHGAMYAMPWKDWRAEKDIAPYVVRFDPRVAYPIAHDARDRLRSAFFLKYRRLVDLELDYGMGNEALANLRRWTMGKQKELPQTVEEIWVVTPDKWGLAIVATQDPTPPNFRYVNPLFDQSTGEAFADWLIPMHDHNLEGCPVVEKRRRTNDGEYRGALDDSIPNLKVAHNLMARTIEALEISIGQPTIVDNIENEEDIGAASYLFGDGNGDPIFETPSRPPNFEAMAHAQSQVEAARNVAAFPQQRSGEPGASINSAKGSLAVMGSFNTALAWNQRDLASFYRQMLNRLANFDHEWCPGSKRIAGWDEGRMFDDTYNPATFWKGDYRVVVGFHSMGMDESQNTTKHAILKNMGAISTRTFVRKTSASDDPIREEQEVREERVADMFEAFAFQQAAEGNLDPVIRYVTKIDEDDKTPREAIKETIKEMFAQPSGGGPGGGAPGQGTPDQALLQQASLEAGGIPGNAEGLPQRTGIGAQLASVLPQGVQRAAASQEPG